MRRVLIVLLLAGCGGGSSPTATPTPTPTPTPPTPTALVEPFDVIEEAGGTLLIADRGANAVYRRRGDELSLVAELPGPRDLEPDGDRVLVASADNVVALDPRTGATSVVATAPAEVLGVARTADGIALTDGKQVLLEGRTLATGLDGAHGLLDTPDGLVVCESFAGRVLLLTDGRRRVLARGMKGPSFAAAKDGAIYVTEFDAHRVSRLEPRREVGEVANPAGLSFAADGSLLVAGIGGTITTLPV